MPPPLFSPTQLFAAVRKFLLLFESTGFPGTHNNGIPAAYVKSPIERRTDRKRPARGNLSYGTAAFKASAAAVLAYQTRSGLSHQLHHLQPRHVIPNSSICRACECIARVSPHFHVAM